MLPWLPRAGSQVQNTPASARGCPATASTFGATPPRKDSSNAHDPRTSSGTSERSRSSSAPAGSRQPEPSPTHATRSVPTMIEPAIRRPIPLHARRASRSAFTIDRPRRPHTYRTHRRRSGVRSSAILSSAGRPPDWSKGLTTALRSQPQSFANQFEVLVRSDNRVLRTEGVGDLDDVGRRHVPGTDADGQEQGGRTVPCDSGGRD